MIKIVHFSSVHASAALLRQTPKGDGHWGEIVVRLEPESADEASWLVVYDRHKEPLATSVPRERRILMVSEPPEFQSYPKSYLDQFGLLLTPYAIARFEGQQIITQTALPWFYGMDIGAGGSQAVNRPWADLTAETAPMEARPFELTAICSNKAQTKNQIRRLRFLAILKAMLGDRLTIFGRGFNPLDDKAAVIDQSRYHLVLENNLLPHGWTEKTADAILGGAFPVHVGAREIAQDFDSTGMLWIDVTKPHEAARAVKACLDEKRAEKPLTRQAMHANKDRLLYEHNLFALLDRLIRDQLSDREKSAALCDPAPILWHGRSPASKWLRPPKLIRKWVWRAEIALLERQ